MPRVPKNPGSGKAPYNGPSRGAGWGGEANGPGTGGAARGSDNPPNIPFKEGNMLGGKPGAWAAKKRARQEKAMEVLETAMDKGETWTVKVMAADKMLDRVEGKAIARNVNVRTDDIANLSDIELAAEQARLDAALAAIEAGSPAAGGEDGSDDVVH